jgi:hypothetical protein
MIYAQITNNLIVNLIELDDPALIPLFQQGYDYCIRIDNLSSMPTVGWAYNPVDPITTAFSPVAQYSVSSSAVFGNQIILQWNTMNVSNGIYVATQTAAFLTYVSQLFLFLSFGYLNDSIDSIAAMIADTGTTKTNLSPFVTNDILYIFLNQLQSYLDLPLTTNPG